MHDILKGAGVAAVAQREHSVADCRDPLHDGEQINTGAQQADLLPLYADADDGGADDLAYIIKGAQLVPEPQGRGICCT